MDILQPFPVIFFTNYINIFHKTEVLTVILVCPIFINLNCIKSYDVNHNFFDNLILILEEKNPPENVSFKNVHFSTISHCKFTGFSFTFCLLLHFSDRFMISGKKIVKCVFTKKIACKNEVMKLAGKSWRGLDRLKFYS